MGYDLAMKNLVLGLLVVFGAVAGVQPGKITPTVPAIYVLGDSTLDVGNNNYLPGKDVPRANMPFYGIDFPGTHMPTGRFSNGYNIADFVERTLGFKKSPPAYLSLKAQNYLIRSALLRGVNYASAGAGILDSTNAGKNIPLSTQVKMFKLTKAEMEAKVGAGVVQDLLARSFFLLSVGSNDIFQFGWISKRRTSQRPRKTSSCTLAASSPTTLQPSRWVPRRRWTPRRCWTRTGGRRARHGRRTTAMAPRAGPSAAAPTATAAPAFPDYTPSMDWMLAGPALPMLGEDDFKAALAPPPPPLYCPIHGHGPCPTRDGTARPLPSPTPPEPPKEDATAPTPPGLDDIHPEAAAPTPPGLDADKMDSAGEEPGLDDVHPEARRLLRKFAAAMAAHRAGPAAGGWNPAALGLSSSNEGGPSSL